MRKDIIKILFAVMTMAVFCGFQQALAIGEDFTIGFLPQYPKAGETVIATIRTYSFDVNRAEIIWQVDGKVMAKGIGKKNLKLTAPDLGKERIITVSINASKDIKMTKSFHLVGNEVDLLWEALTNTPAWYRGKALPVIQSSVKIVAMPYLYFKGAIIPDSNLVYDWFVNYKKDINNSGAGKKSFAFKMNNYDNYIISVSVSSLDGSVVFEKGIHFSVAEFAPKIIFYKEHPMEGVLCNNALSGEISLTENEISLRAEPFFFSKQNLNNLTYQWKMNGKAVTPEQRKTAIDFRLEGASSGNALINLGIQNPVNLLQNAVNSLRINFGTQ